MLRSQSRDHFIEVLLVVPVQVEPVSLEGLGRPEEVGAGGARPSGVAVQRGLVEEAGRQQPDAHGAERGIGGAAPHDRGAVIVADQVRRRDAALQRVWAAGDELAEALHERR